MTTEKFIFSAKAKQVCLALMGVGILGVIIGFAFYDHGRVWGNLLANSYYFIGMSLTGVFLVAAHQIGYGGWHVQIKRVLEAAGSFIPVAGAIALIVIVAGKMHWHHLYHWMDDSLYDPSSPNYDIILDGKRSFLNFPFFTIRIAAYVAIWSLLAYALRKVSIQEDELGAQRYYARNKFLAAVFTVIFAVTSSTASWDFIMSVDPHWYSTLFGWYNFSSYSTAGVALLTLVVLYLKSAGYLQKVNEEHYHNLGIFMFGFSVFWAYLWFSQYMLQWYANMPEETVYFYRLIREGTFFHALFVLNLLLNFFVPFLFLMTRAAKRNPQKLAFASVMLIIGHWLDYYLMVMPGGVGAEHAGLGIPELFILIGFAGAFFYVILNALTKASLVPVNNPFLKESAQHHTLK